MPIARQPAARACRSWRGTLAGLLLALVALFAQVAAATPLPVRGSALAATVPGITVPICGHDQAGADSTPNGERHDHLLTCARCLCCHAPAIIPAPVPRLPSPTLIVYAAQVVLPPATAPPIRLAARPPPRAPPILAARPN